jgi:hypothetical protein
MEEGRKGTKKKEMARAVIAWAFCSWYQLDLFFRAKEADNTTNTQNSTGDGTYKQATAPTRERVG